MVEAMIARTQSEVYRRVGHDIISVITKNGFELDDAQEKFIEQLCKEKQ